MNAVREAFPHVQGRDCVTSALRNLLAWSGNSISEALVFGLGCGLNYWFCRIASCPVPAILGTNLALEEELCTRLGFSFVIREPRDVYEANEVYSVVKSGTPVIIKADPFHFEYCWEGIPRSERQHFGEHVTLVVSVEDDVAWLSDIWHPSLVAVPLDELRAARSCTDGYPFLLARNRWFELKIPGVVDCRPHLLSAAQASARAMLAGRGFFGIEGIANSAQAILNWADQTTRDDISAYLVLISQRMDEGATGSCFRALHAEFLIESAELLGSQELASIGMRWLHDVVPLWQRVISIIRYAADAKAPERELRQLQPIFRTLARLEGDLCQMLLK